MNFSLETVQAFSEWKNVLLHPGVVPRQLLCFWGSSAGKPHENETNLKVTGLQVTGLQVSGLQVS